MFFSFLLSIPPVFLSLLCVVKINISVTYLGGRKTALARVTLWEQGTGEVSINGKDLLSSFRNILDRYYWFTSIYKYVNWLYVWFGFIWFISYILNVSSNTIALWSLQITYYAYIIFTSSLHHVIFVNKHFYIFILLLSPAAPEARDGRYSNPPPPPSVHLFVCPSVTFSFRTVTRKRIDIFSQNFAGTCHGGVLYSFWYWWNGVWLF